MAMLVHRGFKGSVFPRNFQLQSNCDCELLNKLFLFFICPVLTLPLIQAVFRQVYA